MSRSQRAPCATLLMLAVPGVTAVRAQERPGEGGEATLAGVQITYTCTEVPEGAARFYVEVVYANSDVRRAPDLPEYARPLPELVAGIAGVSDGSGSGAPIGSFSFHSKWAGYQPGFVIVARGDIFRTPEGEIHADERFRAVPATAVPNLTFEGTFTLTDGTGRYQGATGSAAAVTKQLGDGERSAFVACGWIDGIGDDR